MMRCPQCGLWNDWVIDTYTSKDAKFIRRRRECHSCGYRYTTYETIENVPIVIIKRDRSRQSFDREKIIDSISRACYKRSITNEQISKCAYDVEYALSNVLQAEVESAVIGKLVSDALKKLDLIAYIRYCSVHHSFKDIAEFLNYLDPIIERINKKTKYGI